MDKEEAANYYLTRIHHLHQTINELEAKLVLYEGMPSKFEGELDQKALYWAWEKYGDLWEDEKGDHTMKEAFAGGIEEYIKRVLEG